MSARVEGMDIRLQRRVWSANARWLAAAAAVAVAVSVVAVSMVQSRNDPVEPAVPASVSAYQGPISGTGPGLAEYARENGSSSAYDGPITGTGPGLAEYARKDGYSSAYEGPITGTGPGLVEIARPSAPVIEAPAKVHAHQILR